MSYHNTTRLSGVQLADQRQRTSMQESEILQIYLQVQNASPWEIWYIFNRIKNGPTLQKDINECVISMRSWNTVTWSRAIDQIGARCVPITSIRRAITNLTTTRHLIRTYGQRIGAQGKPEGIWKLNKTS
jgi:hypothetical protein